MSEMMTLPKGWEEASLSDLFLFPKIEIVDGPFGSNLKSSEYVGSGIPVLRIQNIDRNSFIKKNIVYVTDEKARDLARHSFAPGDIVLTKLGDPVGKACIIPKSFEKGLIVADLIRLRLKHTFINKQWLTYAINAPLIASQLKDKTKGTTRPRVNLGHVRELRVHLPPLNEQNRIVAKIEELFSELDAGVENLKQAKEQLGIYRRSLLKHAFEGKLTEEWRKENADKLESVEALLKRIKNEREECFKNQLEQWENNVSQWETDGKPGKKPVKPRKPKKLDPISDIELKKLPKLPKGWAWATLEHMCDVRGGITVSSKTTYENPQEVPYLRVANVQDCNLDLNEIKTISVSQDKIDQLALQTGDILLNEGGDRDKLGRGWIWEDQIPLCIHQNHVFRARLYTPNFPSKYISYYASAMGKPYFMRQGKQTTNLASISLTKMKGFPIPIPSEEEAKNIVQEIEDKLQTMLSTMADLEHRELQSTILKRSILSKAFSGELVPQDPTDEPASKLLERIKQERLNTPKPKRTRKPKTEAKRITMANLKEILKTANGWISTQDAFSQCGIGDDSPIKQIENTYAELKALLKSKCVEIKRKDDEDFIRLISLGEM